MLLVQCVECGLVEDAGPVDAPFEPCRVCGSDEPMDDVDPSVAGGVARRFAEFLRDHTDTFDPVMVRMALDSGDSLKPDAAMIDSWVGSFVGA